MQVNFQNIFLNVQLFIYFLPTLAGVVALITPTATVCLMSRTAKRPRGGNSVNVSTQRGFVGSRLTMQASPVFTNFGFFSRTLPVRRSIFSLISANLQATWAV